MIFFQSKKTDGENKEEEKEEKKKNKFNPRRVIYPSSHLLQNGLDHLVADAGRFGEPRREINLAALESVLIRGEIPKGDAVGPSLFFHVRVSSR